MDPQTLLTGMTRERLIAALILLTVACCLYLFRHAHTLALERGGRVMLLVGTFVLPLLAMASGVSSGLDGATRTEFCLSCHEMEGHGKSLHIDDMSLLPAAHFQNNRIPRDHACFTCHTDYSMFGDVKAKVGGLRHVYAHYLGGIPEKIELYKPFSNENCLHCHRGARSFETAEFHTTPEAPLQDLLSGKTSCLTDGCHDAGHSTEKLAEVDFWNPATKVVQK